jgi:hypothetical protein
MSNTDYETITRLVICFCIAAIYFYWMKFELKAQFTAKLEEAKVKLKVANEACADESQFSKSRKLLRQANEWLRQISEFVEEVDLDKDLDDLIAVRRQLCFVNWNIDHAMTLRQKSSKVAYLMA